MPYVGGVLYIDSLSATSLKSKADGHTGSALPSKSSRTMTMVTPAGPMFFCAPAKITPYCDTSTTRDRMCDDMSATIGVDANSPPNAAGTRAKSNSTPSMVSLVHMCRYAAPGVSRHCDCGGTALKPCACDDAAIFTLAYLAASLIDLPDQEPVCRKSMVAGCALWPTRFIGTMAFCDKPPPCMNRMR